MESIEKEISEMKKDRKWYAEVEEEWRNKVKSWEGRIRVLEDRMEDVLKEIKEIKKDEGGAEGEESKRQ